MLANESATPYFYPISIDLEYRLASGGMAAKTARGRTVRLSSVSIQFESGNYLPPDTAVEIFIAWPARLENGVALQLYVRGRTVRSQDHLITVEIQRYEFRTRRKGWPEISDLAQTSLEASGVSA